MNESHGVNDVQCLDDLGDVEPGPLFGHVVVRHQVDEVASWHVIHDHVEVLVVLEGEVKLDDPITVGMRHDVSFLPEEGTVTPFDL